MTALDAVPPPLPLHPVPSIAAAMLAEFSALFPGPVEVGARVRLISAGPLMFYGRAVSIDWGGPRRRWWPGMTA